MNNVIKGICVGVMALGTLGLGYSLGRLKGSKDYKKLNEDWRDLVTKINYDWFKFVIEDIDISDDENEEEEVNE